MLRLYFEIAESGDYRKLLVEGEATSEQCIEQWNKIVATNFDRSGSNFDYINYMDTLEGYNHFLNEHNVTTAKLIVLHFQVDDEIINSLRGKGYYIDTSGKLAYMNSLIKAIHRSKHLLSRIKIKANEVQKFNNHLKGNKPSTFEEVMAGLIFNLGFTVPDDITLARYNQLKKFVEEKRKQVA